MAEVDKGPARSYANSQEADSNSKSKTKTASFSQNGYFEELIKVAQRLSTLEKEGLNEEASLESQPPPGFEEVINHQGTKMQLGVTSEILATEHQPLGNGKDQGAQITDRAPPGFGLIITH